MTEIRLGDIVTTKTAPDVEKRVFSLPDRWSPKYGLDRADQRPSYKGPSMSHAKHVIFVRSVHLDHAWQEIERGRRALEREEDEVSIRRHVIRALGKINLAVSEERDTSAEVQGALDAVRDILNTLDRRPS